MQETPVHYTQQTNNMCNRLGLMHAERPRVARRRSGAVFDVGPAGAWDADGAGWPTVSPARRGACPSRARAVPESAGQALLEKLAHGEARRPGGPWRDGLAS